MKNNDNELIYSSRIKTKIEAKDVSDGLKQIFSKVMTIELIPYVKKMIRENDLKPMRAFADWDTGFNTFSVEIFGAEFTPGLEFEVVNPENLILDAEHQEFLSKVKIDTKFLQMMDELQLKKEEKTDERAG